MFVELRVDKAVVERVLSGEEQSVSLAQLEGKEEPTRRVHCFVCRCLNSLCSSLCKRLCTSKCQRQTPLLFKATVPSPSSTPDPALNISQDSNQSSSSQASYTQEGTIYDAEAIEKHRQGVLKGQVHFPDLVTKYIKQRGALSTKGIVEPGCGVGHWLFLAIKSGFPRAVGYDIQSQMIENANQKANDMENPPTFQKRGIGHAKLTPGAYDTALSCVVTCNLPESTLTTHFNEMHRSLCEGGECLVVYPHAQDVVFTKEEGSREEQLSIVEDLQKALEIFNEEKTYSLDQSDEFLLCQTFLQQDQWKNIYSATFYISDGKLTLLSRDAEDTSAIQEGQKVLRLLPDSMVLPNRYYSPDYLIDAAVAAGFVNTDCKTPIFENEQERHNYNVKHPDGPVGEIYERYTPYGLLYLKKPGLYSTEV